MLQYLSVAFNERNVYCIRLQNNNRKIINGENKKKLWKTGRKCKFTAADPCLA